MTYPDPPGGPAHSATNGMPRRGATLHTPAPPGHHSRPAHRYDGTQRAWPPGFDPVAASVRNQTIDRLVRMNVRHAVHAWEHRRDRPVAPHAIAFLYTAATFPEPGPDTEPGGVAAHVVRLFAATRMVNDDPSVRELPQLLFRLTRLVRERYLPTPGGFDPAAQMSTHRDRAIGVACYAGLGVSTLDTPAGSWQEIQRRAEGVDDIPGRCLALLADNTAMLIDRGPTRTTFGSITVHSTGDLNLTPGIPGRPWLPHADVSSMPAPLDVWERMDELHNLILHQPRRPTL